jgi:hypothetical protein
MIISNSVGIAVAPNFTPRDFGNSGAPYCAGPGVLGAFKKIQSISDLGLAVDIRPPLPFNDDCSGIYLDGPGVRLNSDSSKDGGGKDGGVGGEGVSVYAYFIIE